MEQLMSEERFKEFISFGRELATSLDQQQGLRCGESTVISRFLHRLSNSQTGVIQILINRDAGKELAQEQEPGQAIHADIFHAPARVEIVSLARKLLHAIEVYCSFGQDPPRGIVQNQDILTGSETTLLAARIYLRTATGAGYLPDLIHLQDDGKNKKTGNRTNNHVHLLIKDFTAEEMPLIPLLIDGIETELAKQGIEIRKVERIIHVEKKGPKTAMGISNLGEHRFWQLASILSSLLSSPEDLIELLDAFRPGLFRRKQSLATLRNKHGYLRDLVSDLAAAGLIKQGAFADSLSKQGQELLSFVNKHQHELESQLRKMLREAPATTSNYHSLRRSTARSRDKLYSYSSKTTASQQDSWLGSLAIPETVTTAAKNSLRQQRPTLTIAREDCQVYEKQAKKPVDLCLIIDGSASMAGPKMKAVWRLAEHLLLTTRDRVAVVAFQQHEGKVIVPFTRNYSKLKLGLRSINPQGLTPLAHGIVTVLDLIKNNHVHNPLLILITDGVPTYAKWVHPRDDALKAAGMVAEKKIKLICIGVDSNQEFLNELANRAEASLYIVDNLEEEATLIQIVRSEMKAATR